MKVWCKTRDKATVLLGSLALLRRAIKQRFLYQKLLRCFVPVIFLLFFLSVFYCLSIFFLSPSFSSFLFSHPWFPLLFFFFFKHLVFHYFPFVTFFLFLYFLIFFLFFILTPSPPSFLYSASFLCSLLGTISILHSYLPFPISLFLVLFHFFLYFLLLFVLFLPILLHPPQYLWGWIIGRFSKPVHWSWREARPN